jgi:hypothetical protein
MSHETDSYNYMTALILVMLVWFVGTDTMFFFVEFSLQFHCYFIFGNSRTQMQ